MSAYTEAEAQTEAEIQQEAEKIRKIDAVVDALDDLWDAKATLASTSFGPGRNYRHLEDEVEAKKSYLRIMLAELIDSDGQK